MDQETSSKLEEAIASQLVAGSLNSEEACKLLNTFARFEERTNPKEK